MKTVMKILLLGTVFSVLLSIVIFRAEATPPDPLFHCPDATDSKSLYECSAANLDRLRAEKAVPPTYTNADARAYYAQLSKLPEGYPQKESIAQSLLRHRLGEFFYFATPAFPEETGPPPANYELTCDVCMGGFEYDRLKDGAVLVQFWNYVAASQSNTAIYLFAADGTLTPVQSEILDENNTLTLGNATVNEGSFDPKTGILTDGSKGGGGTWYLSEYKLDGHIFRLQKLTRSDPDPKTGEMAAIDTILYERKKN